mmetsp:Transcript_2232/g.6786  ORF Transcript_2232/g.6786 Transcript_2232/m.6786 type:complete len:89 (-) Transcript_2232:140-406(-)
MKKAQPMNKRGSDLPSLKNRIPRVVDEVRTESPGRRVASISPVKAAGISTVRTEQSHAISDVAQIDSTATKKTVRRRSGNASKSQHRS